MNKTRSSHAFHLFLKRGHRIVSVSDAVLSVIEGADPGEFVGTLTNSQVTDALPVSEPNPRWRLR